MNEHEQTALEVRDDGLPAIADDRLVALAEQAEKRVEAMGKIKRMALRLTNANDWVDENGKPYLQASGGEKVARLFGISWRIGEPVKENLEGGHYLYTYEGEFSLGGVPITAVGTRSSKDGFFKAYRWEGPEDNRRKVELPASEIDVGNVKKSAYTNCIGNGITRLLGLRNLSWEDLQEFAGIRHDQVASVEYKKGGKPAGKPAQRTEPHGGSQAAKPAPTKPAPAPTSEAGENGGGATENQAKAIYAILINLGIKDELARAQKVQGILGLPSAPTSMSKLTKAQASAVIQALQAEVDGGGA